MTVALKNCSTHATTTAQKFQYDTNGVLTSGVVKARAATFFEVSGYNNSANTRYFQMFNSATVPADAVVPDLLPISVPAAGTFTFTLPEGVFFDTGLSWASSSTFATKTVTGVADMWVTVTYK